MGELLTVLGDKNEIRKVGVGRGLEVKGASATHWMESALRQ